MHERQTFLGFRQLLARIRDVMAGEGDARSRLSRTVQIIADGLRSQVCSIYVRRAGEVLELFATQGLRPTAVHVTRLRFGEGLIGEIAASGRPLALADAQHHPRFVYRPETGEEVFQSFMGVPIMSGGRILGVLAVQSVDRRIFSDEEIEILQTVAMVLAELVSGGDLVGRDELAPTEGIAVTPLRLEGATLNAGLGIGFAVHHQPRIAIRTFVADDIGAEHDRFGKAVVALRGTLDTILEDPGRTGATECREVVESYRMIATDVGWLRRIGDAINTGLTAEAAVQKVTDEIRARMSQITDPYLRERAHDFEDLANQLLQHLLGAEQVERELPPFEDVVIVARNMGAAELLKYDRRRLRGLILEEGSSTAHVAIVAKALDIPAVGHARDALGRIDVGDMVIVDGDHCQVFVRPSEHVRGAFQASLRSRNDRKAAYAKVRDLPAVTRDGTRISVNINAGLLVDLTHFDELGADGIGLYRTEIPFLVRSDSPDLQTQEVLYRRVLDYAREKPVIFRTLDIGGDKIVPYVERTSEENPAMGWRAIRVSLDRPAMLRQQLRAMIRAAEGREFRVMFPMLSQVDEYLYARALLERELERERLRGQALPGVVRTGAMLEVPALIFQLPTLLRHVDFVSIGTNDLLQFLFACDRSSARLGGRYDTLSPVMLNVLLDVSRQCAAAGVPVSVCGEMAGDPLSAMALVGIGYRSLSVAPPRVGPVKMMIRAISLPPLESYMASLCQSTEPSVRHKLVAFARDHEVNV